MAKESKMKNIHKIIKMNDEKNFTPLHSPSFVPNWQRSKTKAIKFKNKMRTRGEPNLKINK